MLNGGNINNVLGSPGRLAGSSHCLHTWTRSKGKREASDAHSGSRLSAAGKKKKQPSGFSSSQSGDLQLSSCDLTSLREGGCVCHVIKC